MPDERNLRHQKRIEAMVRFLQLSICFLSVFWLSACATIGAAKAPDELERTLDEAIVAIPAFRIFGIYEDVRDVLALIPAYKKMPLVIYMHGCSGLMQSALSDIGFLAHHNYAVLAPNSFARKYRPEACNPETCTGGLFRGVLDFRLAEASYAHEAAKNLPWVDKRNIFMMGFSEGGITTAKYGRGSLAGRIILGWTCNAGWPEYNGISGPRDEPILTIVASNDPWFTSPDTFGDCGSSMLFRPNSESVVVDSTGHYIHGNPELRKKILQFLESNRRH